MSILGLIGVFTVFAIFILAVGFLMMLGGFTSIRHFRKGHLHEYDPSGEYTYKHQNIKYNGPV